jgi:DNA polymerase III subunit gamma/tau
MCRRHFRAAVQSALFRMSYQVIARKWRPQKFDDVVGQSAVTRTLRNALTSNRLAQAFVFAGPRGVGKTTTARILARALNCVKGPTPDPCGVCDACVEIAEGRDMDVLEIDAATHTQVENVREVIVSGLSILPVRDKFKVFIIDEVHQLSGHSFNALLKSVEEPPAHVVFMMATTELDRIPETILSRSQVYEFRTISSKAISEQLRRIVDAMEVAASDDSLLLIARDADGSMRDAQSKLDQVIAFSGNAIGPSDVASVLGLVGRDLLLDAVDVVADENAPAAFDLAARAVEKGYDLRAVCRELARTVRDLMVLSVDPSRVNDPEIVAEGDRDRLLALARRFSREDLLRAFDLLARAEVDIRTAAQPRYHLEMVLLRWIHLRKLTPIEELIAGAGSSAGSGPSGAGRTAPTVPARLAPAARPAPPAGKLQAMAEAASVKVSAFKAEAGSMKTPAASASKSEVSSGPAKSDVASGPGRTESGFKDAFLAEIRKGKPVLYNMVVAQAQKIEIAGDRVTFTFSASQRALRDQFEQNRTWLESTAQQAGGRKIAVSAVQTEAAPAPAAGGATPQEDKKAELRKQAMADAGVQAMLEVFPVEIRDVEEM